MSKVQVVVGKEQTGLVEMAIDGSDTLAKG